MQRDSELWSEVNPSRFPWEREGLAFIREALPPSAPYRGWPSSFSVAGHPSCTRNLERFPGWLSPKPVRNHVSLVMVAFHARDRSPAIVIARRAGLGDADNATGRSADH